MSSGDGPSSSGYSSRYGAQLDPGGYSHDHQTKLNACCWKPLPHLISCILFYHYCKYAGGYKVRITLNASVVVHYINVAAPTICWSRLNAFIRSWHEFRTPSCMQLQSKYQPVGWAPMHLANASQHMDSEG